MMNTTASIKRRVADYDDMGSVIYSASTIATGVRCRISESVPSEVRSQVDEWSQASTMIYITPATVPPPGAGFGGTEYKRDDEVHYGSVVYEVLGTMKTSVPNHHTVLVCKKKTDGS